jgi:hypothetical protein
MNAESRAATEPRLLDGCGLGAHLTDASRCLRWPRIRPLATAGAHFDMR